MKKKSLKNLMLKKSSISNLNSLSGGCPTDGFTVAGACAEIHPSSFQNEHLGILGCEAACVDLSD